ncbi:T9SS type A sorting domain-containing protein [Dyadobacter luticola]|uniref:T9SS type A sorting domain-containing protein n=1 Tax=Dyadobacter luticola TaxID=1979387 RepID=A0A5R9L654_9BACT|nr:T9SS type A sorting domain-containing protein [Dyadobacter luticola]TLV03869.1 T9SS type A sorting domain-containing protein [Dyadobacter luticola]
MRAKPLHAYFYFLLKTLFVTLLMGFLVPQQAFGQLYSHNFNNQNVNSPQTISSRITASWNSEGGSLYYRPVNNNYGLAIVGKNHTYVLTLTMQERYQAEITSISFKKLSGDNATFQIKVNEQNYGASFGSDNNLLTATRSVTVSKLRNTITIKIAVTNGNDRNQQYSEIDDLVIDGTVSLYDPAAEATPDANGILYVNKNVNSPGSGGSWDSALPQLYFAFEAARNKPAVKEIWVAKADYQPETDGGYFSMVSGVKVYGGFYGFEDSPLGRNVLDNRTTLKGRGNTVIYNNGIDNTARLDGFYIAGGAGFLADGVSVGAGMYNVSSSPTIVNCIFTDNKTDPAREQGRGGAIYNKDSSPAIIQSLFYLNEAKGSSQGAGGAIFNENSSPVLTNCTFTENSTSGSAAEGSGGAIANAGNSSPQIRNTIIWSNTDDAAAGGISSISAIAPFDGTPVVAYSLVQGGFSGGTQIIDADPQFENPSDHNYRQRNTSPAINAGDPATDLNIFPGDGEFPNDLSANNRTLSTRIDLGVFEVVPLVKWRVNAANTAENADGLTWETAFPTLQQALDAASQDDEIWVAKGEYQPGPGESFYLIHGVKFYGGFAGNESAPDQRPRPIQRGNDAGATILKGNGASVITNLYNNISVDDIFDGFTIKGGSAENGGGMYLAGVSMTITNCAFVDNQASRSGGAIFHSDGFVSIYSTIFSGNNALDGSGGAVRSSEYAYSYLYSCLFIGNTATETGGAIMSDGYDMTMINCTVSRNTAPTGGAIGIISPASSRILNSIISGNSSGLFKVNTSFEITTSIVQGMAADDSMGVPDGSIDPQFTDPNSDFTLKPCSPAINRGYGTDEPPVTGDLNGNQRIFNANIDMGAYEFQGIPEATSLASGEQSVDLFVFGGVTAFSKDCQTLAFIEPTDGPTIANMLVTSRVANTPTLVAGTKVFVKRYIDITPQQVLSGNMVGNVTLLFTKQEFDDYNAAYGNSHNAKLPAKLKVVAYHGTSASGLPETYSGEMEVIDHVEVTTSPDGNIYMVKFAVTEFSGFFVSGQSAGALPVTLVSFEANKKENSAYLTWQTSSEINSEAFEIQHSTDGKAWKNIGRVAAAENAATFTNYSYTHKNPAKGDNLYRLKMVDTDGTFAYSTIRNLRFGDEAGLTLFPNPAVHVREIGIRGVANEDIEWIRIYNAEGKVVKEVSQPKGNVEVSGLPDGTYQVGVFQKNGLVQTSKMVILN